MKNEVDNGKGGIALEAGVVLKMQGICMTFPGVKALEGVDLTLKKGEIRALMGENGAGKSTLIKCLTGVNKFEAGEIYLEGFDHPIYCISGSKPLSKPFGGRESLHRPRAADKAWNGQPKGNEPSGSCPYETAGA